LLVGLTLSLVMGRRGHDAFGWLLLGTLFGPLAAVFAVEARGQERPGPKLVAVRRSIGPGPVDVLAGVDGSPESEAALLAAAGILGPRLGRLTLATVIPYDSGFDRERTARAALERQAAAAGAPPRPPRPCPAGTGRRRRLRPPGHRHPGGGGVEGLPGQHGGGRGGMGPGARAAHGDRRPDRRAVARPRSGAVIRRNRVGPGVLLRCPVPRPVSGRRRRPSPATPRCRRPACAGRSGRGRGRRCRPGRRDAGRRDRRGRGPGRARP